MDMSSVNQILNVVEGNLRTHGDKASLFDRMDIELMAGKLQEAQIVLQAISKRFPAVLEQMEIKKEGCGCGHELY